MKQRFRVLVAALSLAGRGDAVFKGVQIHGVAELEREADGLYAFRRAGKGVHHARLERARDGDVLRQPGRRGPEGGRPQPRLRGRGAHPTPAGHARIAQGILARFSPVDERLVKIHTGSVGR